MIINKSVSLVGHPFAPIGMGEHVRCSFRSFRSVAMSPNIVDIYGLNKPDLDSKREFGSHIKESCTEMNIFHINGDEVEQSLAHLQNRMNEGSFNIIYPAWELARYPKEWAAQLDRFDEIWAPSEFIQKSLEPACEKPVLHMPLATEVILSSFLNRRYFGIPESDYTFLFFFDLQSYSTRKNPEAVILAFKTVLKNIASDKKNISLVMKVNGCEHNPSAFTQLKKTIAEFADKIVLIENIMTDNEVKNLVRCCDCFISLHRSEGFGRGMAEAMFLGKPVIATGYSGNMDFMSEDNAFIVPYELVPVNDGDYPHWENQVWAEPNISVAVKYMLNLIHNPSLGYQVGAKASKNIRVEFGYRAVGLRYRNHIEMIMDKL